jgi:signal transduction histidine kinase
MSTEGLTTPRENWRRSTQLGLVAVLPIVFALALATPSLLSAPGQPLFPCPLYPNAVVSLTAVFYDTCPLESGDRIRAVTVEGRRSLVDSEADLYRRLRTDSPAVFTVRRGPSPAEREIEISPIQITPTKAGTHLATAAILSAILLTAVLVTAVRAPVAAALPFALIYASVGVAMVGAVAGWVSSSAYVPAAIARALLPAAIAHLALVFPRPREIVQRVPTLTAVPYWGVAILAIAELNAAYTGPASTMLLIQRILLAATAVAPALLCLSCVLAMRESPSLLTRRQARAFLTGLIGLFLGMGVLWLTGLPGGLFTVVTLGAAFSPLPLGYAIARYHLFDLDVAVRRTAAHVLYLSVCSGGVFLALMLLRDQLPIPEIFRSPPVLFAAVYAVLAPADILRHRLKRLIASAVYPTRRGWEHLAKGRASEMATLRDPEDVARVACSVLREGLPNAETSVFLLEGEDFRLANATGPGACTDPRMAAIAARAWENPDPVDLNRIDILSPELSRVYETGVEASCPIRTQDTVLGWILVSPDRRGMLLTSSHLTWLRAIAAQAAAAIENARLAEDLGIAEQFAAKGRMHAELAHEIGKPLGTLEILARRLSRDASDPARTAQRATSIARLARQLRGIVRGVLAPGVDGEGSASIQPADLIQRACQETAWIHGEGRILVHPLPPLSHLPPGSDRLVRALANLFDNAVRSMAPDGVVEVDAREENGWIEIEIRDTGCGIPREQLERVFDAFVSHREGGTGLGLPISRQIVEQLGGSLSLTSRPGVGTEVMLRLPVSPMQEIAGQGRRLG